MGNNRLGMSPKKKFHISGPPPKPLLYCLSDSSNAARHDSTFGSLGDSCDSGLLSTASLVGVVIFVCKEKIRESFKEVRASDRWKVRELKFTAGINFACVRSIAHFW